MGRECAAAWLDRRVCRSAVLLALACVPALAPGAERVHRYTVSAEDDLRSLGVRVCFSGTPPPQLVVESLDAPAAFVDGKAPGAARRFAPNGTELSLKGVPDNGCIEYLVNLGGGQGKHDYSGNSTKRIGKDVFTEIGLWFWRPAELAADEDLEVSFTLPEGMSVSAPWRPVAGAKSPTYRVGRGAYDRPASVAIGRFHEIPVEVPGAVLRLAVLDGAPAPDAPGMTAWIRDAAMSVAAVYGRFPVPSPQILVMPGARAQEPTPWAYVLRGGQAAAHFFVNQRRPLAEYVEDWTAPHELSHLLLPYVTSSDAWLSEGMATYYQNVVRARSGAITPGEAWQRMHAGFRRGQDWGANKSQTLAQATERMFRDGGYMRVYWQGTAILLAADVELRRRSGGKQSLDTVLEAFGVCCLDPDPEWTARKVFDKFDEISGTNVFRTQYDVQINAPGFPSLGDLYGQLGLDALGGKLVLRDDAPLKGIRDAIMAPGPYRTPRALLDPTRR